MKRFEFVLCINGGKIICQRYFEVKNYNENMLNTIDLMWCVEEIASIVQEDLKKKSEEYLWGQFNPYEPQTDYQVINIWDKEDIFDISIKVDERVVAVKQFTGNLYPQRVRYSVDIREIIPSIINRIKYTLNQENYSMEFENY